jgi:hypothetical protein
LKASLLDIKPIKLTRLEDLPAAEETRLIKERFAHLATQVNDAYRTLYGGAETGADAIVLLAAVSEFLELMNQLDREYGPDAPLPIEDATEAADETLRCLAELETWLDRLQLAHLATDLDTVTLGVGLWAMRHDCAIRTVEPLVNAVAERVNHAATKQDVAAAYGLMQGLIEFFAPTLGADLERSNPQRPWRMLNLNFAIAAIRSGDEVLMRFAFDKLNRHLPDDRAGFYVEALQMAEQAGLPEDAQALIRGQALKWTRVH